MTEALIILAVTLVVMMAVFCLVEKWWAKSLAKLNMQTYGKQNEVYTACLKFYMPSGWYCEFKKGKALCYGVLNIPEGEHQKGEILNVKIKGFSDLYNLELV